MSANGEPNCGPTNRAKHRYKLRTVWHPIRGWQTYHPDGTPITPTTRDHPQTDNGP